MRPKSVEQIVIANLRALMLHHKQLTPTDASRYTKFSQQQMDRLLKGQRMRLDTLEKLAKAYGLDPYQLLIPNLKPANPQVLRPLSPTEEALYKALEAARRE